MSDTPNDGKKYWLDEKKNVDKIWYALLVLCALLFLGDALYHKHTHFAVEGWFGFYGLYGFIACVALVLAARVLRVILMRPEDYYDKADD
jgi:asparagine N-glycosylation enzyme membrane subunit Stt3